MKLLQNYTMRFYKILFSLLPLFLIACNRDAAPDNLIKEEQFVPLLVDIHIADGYLSSKPQMPDSLSYYGNGLYDAIFKKYHVDSAQFKKSYQYYVVHLAQMSRIYKAVAQNLTAKNDSITKRLAAAEMEKSRRKTDSVAKAFKADSVRIKAKRDSNSKAQKAKLKK